MRKSTVRKWAAGTGAQRRTQKLLIQYMVLALAAMAAMGVLVAFFCSSILRKTARDAAEDVLHVAADQLNDRMQDLGEGDWMLDDQGRLCRGGSVIQGGDALLHQLEMRTGLDYAVYFGRVRVLATSDHTRERDIQAGEAVFSSVVLAGTACFAEAGTRETGLADAYYVPLKNPDGTIVGMTAAYRQRMGIPASALQDVLLLVLLALGLIAVSAAMLVVIARRASAQMGDLASVLSGLSRGSLKNAVNQQAVNRRDEIGEMASSARQLDAKLTRVIRTSKEASRNLCDSGYDLADSCVCAADASEQVAEKMDEMRKCTATQAQSVRAAAGDTGEISRSIRGITEDTKEISEYAGEASVCSGRASEAVQELANQADQLAVSVHDINLIIRSTNEAVKRITSCSQAIAGIAAQTNLLALNASIEASRAGEAGVGFSVVAEEIRGLADESRHSAEEIRGIVEQLLAESEASVTCLSHLNGHADRQGEMLREACADMRFVADSTQRIGQTSAQLAGRVDELNRTREDLEGVLRDLSAASVQNVAFTEETTASMQELQTTFTVISESAGQLQGFADDLQETMSFFRV